MKSFGAFSVFLLVALAGGGRSLAAPIVGGVFFLGGASHSQSSVTTSTDYGSAGIGIGGGFQEKISDACSVSGFLLSSFEVVHGSGAAGRDAGHGVLGVQLRFWVGDLFAGAQLGIYSETLLDSSSNPITGTGPWGGRETGCFRWCSIWMPPRSTWTMEAR